MRIIKSVFSYIFKYFKGIFFHCVKIFNIKKNKNGLKYIVKILVGFKISYFTNDYYISNTNI